MYSLEAKIRKQQNILISSGIGVILFGVWSIVRIVLMRYMDPDGFAEFISSVKAIETIENEDFEQFVFIVTMAILSIDLLARLYIGLKAINDGRGRYKKYSVYVVIAAIYVIVSYYFDIVGIYEFINDGQEIDSLLNEIVDFTANIATIEIVIAAVKIRILENRRFKETCNVEG